MKKLALIISLLATFIVTHAQEDIRHFYTRINVGKGIAMSEPKEHPFLLNVEESYKFNAKLEAGIGAGLSIYEETVVPIYANARYKLTQEHPLVPFLDAKVGYAVPTNKETNGGFYLNPSFGIEYTTLGKLRPYFLVGYGYQYFEHLKSSWHENIFVSFPEELNHHSLCLSLGVEF